MTIVAAPGLDRGRNPDMVLEVGSNEFLTNALVEHIEAGVDARG